jgi:hypothetical protein
VVDLDSVCGVRDVGSPRGVSEVDEMTFPSSKGESPGDVSGVSRGRGQRDYYWQERWPILQVALGGYLTEESVAKGWPSSKAL